MANAGEDTLDRTESGVAAVGIANVFATDTIFWWVNMRERNVTVVSRAARGQQWRGLRGVSQGNFAEAKEIIAGSAGSAGILKVKQQTN